MKIKVLRDVQGPNGTSIDLVPTRATPGASGLDLRAAESLTLPARVTTLRDGIAYQSPGIVAVSTGISIELMLGEEAQIRPRSGLALKHGITVLNSPGTVDSDYRGEIRVILINHGSVDFIIKIGDRIAQLVIGGVWAGVPEVVTELSNTQRGAGGFGSTGKT